jgi:hypothetical protein
MSYSPRMRAWKVWPFVLGALTLVGCDLTGTSSSSGGDDYYPPGGDNTGGWTSTPGGTDYQCMADADCNSASLICSSTFQCMKPSAVHAIHVNWTLDEKPASTTTCANAPTLELSFTDVNGYNGWGYAPVPCAEGKFTIIKMPVTFVGANMGSEDGTGSYFNGSFDGSGNTTIDLQY